MRQDIEIIGAPRSGTNMLRDVLTRLPDFGTWPCDEINYIWRHGNVAYPSDEFRPEMATDTVRHYIRGHFEKIARKQGVNQVVEKTCANSLRVEFVREVIPAAKFIIIRRDGIDAVASAMKRWKAQLDLPYVLKKARFVPPTDLFFYASRYFVNRLHRIGSKEGRLASWGPRLDNMESVLSRYSLPEVCAIQWKRCVDATDDTIASFASDSYHEVSYESFVRDPIRGLEQILHFLDTDIDGSTLSQAVGSVTDKSVGAGRRMLPPMVKEQIEAIASDTLERHGYT